MAGLLYIVDEPLAGIDPERQETKINQNSKVKIGAITYNVKSTLEIVDRAYIIFEGRVLFEGKK